ncbi:hypothetical protein DYB30_009407 [Aphanomyces astaci]|uniref:Peroxisomal membrane protein PEX16 n=1 Tax=Aphanomyces astaci TaxID=112090 RepID=A0A397E8V3_APHAT|nr:hypothetical protein DYB30_009407 [Aphanomyces astaci]
MTSVHAPQLPGDVHPLLNKYHAWVLENESFARRLENVLYVVPMLVPATLGNPDVVSEVGYSMGGLLKLYHDWVLYQVTPPSDEKTLTADNTSFSIVQAARVPLSIISQVQVAAEMISLKVGGKQSRILLSTSVDAKRKRLQNDKVDEEYHRRKMCLFLYLLRNPVFSSVTEPVVEGVRVIPCYPIFSWCLVLA